MSSLQGRVGRHAKTGGRHCRNFPQDQTIIVNLLNGISASQGGSGGGLRPRIVDGMAADDLFQGILRFEDRHFPGQGSGFVDPGGRMFQLMERLASLTGTPATAEQHNAQPPSSIDQTIALAERQLIGSPYQGMVLFFLRRIKADGSEKVIRNERLKFYVFGHGRIQLAGSEQFLEETLHNATPLFLHSRFKTNQAVAVLVSDGVVMILKPQSVLLAMPEGPGRPGSLRSQQERDELRRRLGALDNRP